MYTQDIEDSLSDLIIKYRVDRFFPRFQKRQKAIQYLTGYFARYEKQQLVLVASCETDSLYIQEDFLVKESQVLYYDQITQEEIEEIKSTQKKVIVVSYYKRREMISFFQNHNIEAYSVYDYLAAKNLILEGNYYDVFGEEYCGFVDGQDTFDYQEIDMNAMFFYDRRCYEISQEEAVEEFYLSRMIFDCVYSKNFPLAEQYIQEYAKRNFPDADQYQQFLLELNTLLEKIKKSLKDRKQEDVVIFWLDQLEYREDEDMPFLKSLKNKGLNFENAYTVTPYTHSTARVLFTGEYIVDDRSYERWIDKKSHFIKNIEKQGYRFKFYTYLEEVENSVKGRITQNRYTPLSEICWNVFRDMLKTPSPLCVVIHELPHTHSPYVSFGLSQNYYSHKEVSGQILSDLDIKIRGIQRKESRKYTDDVLRYFDGWLSPAALKIFMSDHGSTMYNRWHTIFRVVQEKIQPQEIKEIFSYINFETLIFKLLNEEYDLSCILSHYAFVQDVDYYDMDHLKAVLLTAKPRLHSTFGYKGVVTEKDQYIRYNDGRTEYINLHSGQERVTEERETYLSNLVTEYPKELIAEDKFKYSRNIYRTFERYYERCGEFEHKKRKLVKDLFSSFEKDSIVAVAGDEWHILRMWFTLEWSQRNNIDYIICWNKTCMASRLGVKIITPDECRQYKIDTIVISSFEQEELWDREIRENIEEVNLVRLYQYLSGQGVVCNEPYYWEEVLPEDVVWEE